MELNDVPVTLIVKAPTQQIEDQTIRCSSDWTVARLKNHLSEVYPNKPNPGDQRLIFYGQLLTDSETLRDVLMRFGSEEKVHPVHLVCLSSKDSFTRTASGTTSERAQNVRPPQTPIDQQQPIPPTPEDAYRFFMNPAGYQPWMNNVSQGYFQQLAWAQQAYANYYMTQYMDMLARQNGGNPTFVPPGAQRNDPRPADAAPQRLDDDERNRDWLDNFYLGARILILFSIVYLYSSPARFFVVSFLGILLYLYQVGFFRIQMPALENNNEVLNNNIAAENNNLVQGVAAQEPIIGDEVPQTVPPVPQPPVPPPPERPSIAAVTWTFLSSLVASLIPENQNAV